MTETQTEEYGHVPEAHEVGYGHFPVHPTLASSPAGA